MTERTIHAAIEYLRHLDEPGLLNVARQVAAQLAEDADYYDQLGHFPQRNIERLWNSGLGALSIDRQLGGIGASLHTCVRVLRIIAAADGSTGLIYKWQLSHLRNPASHFPEALYHTIIQQALDGPALIGGLRAEAELGTPARGGLPATVARSVTGADGLPAWRLNGHKVYATGSDGLAWFMVWAATDPSQGPVQAGYFFVPAHTPGIEIVAGSWDQLGMRASASQDVIFRDVEIPLTHAVGLLQHQQQDTYASAFNENRYAGWGATLEGALYAGIAESALQWLASFLNWRTPSNLGAPLATLDHLQRAIGDLELRRYTSEQLLEGLAQRIDTDPTQVSLDEPAQIKTLVVDNSTRLVEHAITLAGNHGLAKRNPLQRFLRDVLCGRIHTPSADAVSLKAGRRVLSQAKEFSHE